MDCRNCGAALGTGDVFCGNCGAQADASPPPPAAQPTQVMPQVAQAPQAAPAPAVQPTQQMPQVTQDPPAYPPSAPSAYPAPQPGSPVAAPVKKGPNAGVMVGVVAGGLVLLGLLGSAIVFGGLALFRSSGDPVVAPVESEVAAPPAATPAEGVFATALEAAQSEVPDGYVLELSEETDVRKVYWSGPPASEWDAVIVVEQADGGWRVTDTSAFNAGAEGAPASGAVGATEAQQLVTGFLTAIKEDRPDDAQKSTISPFRDDPASAAVSNGEFKQFSIDSVEPRDDGTFWVYTTEVWSWGTDQWRYDVVPTEAGLRIRALEPAAP